MKNKLSSRKFWCALIGFIVPILTVLGFSEAVTENAVVIIMSISSLMIYVLAESVCDCVKMKYNTNK